MVKKTNMGETTAVIESSECERLGLENHFQFVIKRQSFPQALDGYEKTKQSPQKIILIKGLYGGSNHYICNPNRNYPIRDGV